MIIFVNSTSDHRSLTFKVQPSDFVSDLKSLISQKEYIKPNEQTLYFGTKPLRDDQTLQDYNITDTSTIHLNLKLRGGSELKVHPKTPQTPYLALKNEEFFSLQGVIEDVKKRENLLPQGSDNLQELKKAFLSGCEARVNFKENGGIYEIEAVQQNPPKKMGISGSGKYLAYTGKDGVLRVLDVTTKEEIEIQAKTEASTQEMRAVIFSADDRYILTGSYDGTVKCYDFPTRQELFMFENEPHNKGQSPFKNLKPVRTLALSHDNKYFVIASGDDSIKIVDLHSKEVYHSFPEAHQFRDNRASIQSLWITKDNNYFVSAADDGTVKIWDIQRKQEIHHFTDVYGNLGGLAAICISEDGRYMVHARKCQIRLYDFQLRKLIHTFAEKTHTREIEELKITQGNKYIVSTCTNGSINVYDFETRQQILWQDQVAGCKIKSFYKSSSIAQNGKLAAVSGEKCLKLINLENADQANHFPSQKDQITSFAFSNDNSYLVATFWNGAIKVFDLTNHKEVAYIEKAHKDLIAAFALSHDNKYMVTAGFDRVLKIYNFEQRTEIESIPNISSSGYYATSLFFSRDSKWLVVGSDGGFVKVLDFQTKKEIFSFDCKLGDKFQVDQQKMLAFSRSGKYIASPTGDLDILIYDTETRKVHCEIKQAHKKKVRSLQISNDDKYLISASNDKTIKVFSIQTQELIHSFENFHEGQVSSIILSHDGRYLISGSEDYSLKVLDLATKKQIHQFNQIQSSQMPILAFSPDSSLFAFRSRDNSVQVYKFPFSNPDWVYPISSKVPFYSAIGKYEKLILDSPQETNNLKAYQDLYFAPYNWTVLHLLAIYEPSELSKMPSYPDLQVPTLLDIYNKTPLQYLLAQENIDYSSINNMLKYILEYVEDSDNRTFAEKTAIISSISPLLPFILSKTSANLVNRFLKLCFDQPSTVHNETFPRFGQNNSKYCLTNAPILNSDIQKEIYNYGQAQVTFSASFLHYDYDPLSNDMLKSIVTLQEVEDEDIFRYRAISSMIDHLWRTSWFFHFFMGLLFTIHITLMSVYIGLGDRNLGMAIVILALSGFFLASEALQCYILKLKYLSTIWNWSDLIYHAIVIGTIAAGLDDNYSQLSRGWLYSTIIIVGYVRLVSYLRLFSLTRNLIRTIIVIVMDIRGFVLILFLIILGFSLIFLEFDRGFNYLDHFYATYQILYGNADYDDYSPSQKILLGLILFFISIVLLNMLIAMMGDSYEKVQSKQILTDSHTKLEMILESTILMRMFFPKRQSKKGYLMFCEPSPIGDDDAAGNEWEGRVNIIKKMFKQSDENVANLREDVKAIENNVKNLEKKMDENYRSILMALQSLQK